MRGDYRNRNLLLVATLVWASAARIGASEYSIVQAGETIRFKQGGVEPVEATVLSSAPDFIVVSYGTTTSQTNTLPDTLWTRNLESLEVLRAGEMGIGKGLAGGAILGFLLGTAVAFALHLAVDEERYGEWGYPVEIFAVPIGTLVGAIGGTTYAATRRGRWERIPLQ